MPKRKFDELNISSTLVPNKKRKLDDKLIIKSCETLLTFDETVKKYRLNNIKTIDDILGLVGLYFDKKVSNTIYDKLEINIDFKKIFNLVEPLLELKNMIGMIEIKSEIVSLIRFYLCNIIKDDDMKHLIIYGPPGCGKTTLISIIAKIFQALDIFNKAGEHYSQHKIKIHYKKNTDFIGKYVGHTAQNTKKILNNCLGGILVIDEAYSLGYDRTRGNSDGFSKDVFDTLNQYLSEYSGEFICILAGYKKEINKCVLAYNPGLNRRFPFRFTIKKYSEGELVEIFKKIVMTANWKLEDNAINSKFIKKYNKYFKNQGGDLETLFQKCKICYSRRIFYLENDYIIKNIDIKNGMKLFIKNKEINKNEENVSKLLMYS